MKIVLKGVEHEVDPGKLTLDEGCTIEDVLDVTFTEFGEMLTKGSMKALRAYALVLVQRADPTARIADVGKMDISELAFVQEPADKKKAGRAKAGGDETPDPTRKA